MGIFGSKDENRLKAIEKAIRELETEIFEVRKIAVRAQNKAYKTVNEPNESQGTPGNGHIDLIFDCSEPFFDG